MLIFFLANVFIIALPLAIFEVWLEKFKEGPWGHTEFRHRFWGMKMRHAVFRSLLQKKYVTPYHLLIFPVMLTAILAGEWIVFASLSTAAGWIIYPNLHIFGPIGLLPVIYFPAVWLGVVTLEDLFWFALNWRAPDSLARLLRKEFPWHTDYWPVNLARTKWLPKFYLQVPVLLVVLFMAQYVAISYFH